jgi:uncharacterized membrane-anchored protein YitT (DUF2179 family)
MWIYLILACAWALKTFLHPLPAASWAEFVGRSAVGPVPGEVVLLLGLLYNGLLFLIGFATLGLHQASGEVLPKFGAFSLAGLWRAPATAGVPGAAKQAGASARVGRRRQELLALIIASQPEVIAARVMEVMKRGVTALHGRGMFAQQERDVLLVATTATEMAQLKSLVSAADPNAFVIVTPAREVLGRGFRPLRKA